MAKATPDAVLDAMADYIIGKADRLYVCTTAPADYAGIAAVTLATITIDSSDFTKADDTSGRKVTISQQAGASISANGTAEHIVIGRAAATSELLYVTTCTAQVLTSGGTVTVPAWVISVADPT